ncbi:MAG: hypothetical protein ABFD07_10985 [Methanobacterium sp.]
MLDIGKDKLDNNLFIIGKNSGDFIANRIINSYDLEGHNCLYVGHTYKHSSIRPNCTSKFYSVYTDIGKILEENLFKIDIIVVIVDKNYSLVLSTIRNITDIPTIFIGDELEDFYSLKDFKYVYQMYVSRERVNYNSFSIEEMQENFLKTSYIKDIRSEWVTSLKGLETEYKREKKIELILNKKKDE